MTQTAAKQRTKDPTRDVKRLAKDVRRQAGALNEALFDAREFGLTVEITIGAAGAGRGEITAPVKL